MLDTRRALVSRAFVATFGGFIAFFTIFFAPAIFGKLMASGDGLLESIPAFMGSHSLWEPNMLLGYPLFADPNQQYWYPLAWLRVFPHTFNAFAVAPFVFAASGMAGFVRMLTRSTLGGVVAGLVYALGGFMISHAGHLMLSHPAAWAPFVLWAFECARRRSGYVPIVAGAVALALCGVAGQPQIVVFTATLAGAYAIVSASRANSTPLIFLLRASASLALGLALASTQLLPEALLAKDSTRASLSFDQFTAFEIPAAQLALRIAFPYLLGTSTLPWYPLSRIDLGSFTEETLSVGFVSLVLALLAIRYANEDRRVAFWYAIAFGALVLAVGDATPVAGIMHRLPVYGLFRAPGRHAFEFTFAIALLAGYGAAGLVSGRARAKHLSLATACVTIFAAFAYAQLVTGHPSVLQQIVAAYGVDAAHVISPVENGAVGIPLVSGTLGVLLLWIAARTSRPNVAAVIVVLAVVTDVGPFGWSAYWHWAAASDRDLIAPSWVAALGAKARRTHTRIAWLPGVLANQMAPNLTTLWSVPIVGGYTPIVPLRTEALLGITAAGGTAAPGVSDASLDLAGASVVATTAEAVSSVSANQPFSSMELGTFIGSPRETAISSAAFGLPSPFLATRVALVSELGDSPTIPDKATVANITIVDVAGQRQRVAIVAGRDTAEFAYDRVDVRPRMRHRRARIFDGDMTTHRYVSFFNLTTRLPIKRVDVRWTYMKSAGALTIDKLSLVDDRHGLAAAFGSFAAFFAAPNHWRLVVIDPSILAFENLQVLPHAWLAAPIATSDGMAAARAVRSGTLPTGASFDARREAILEEDDVHVRPPNGNDRVRIVEGARGFEFFVTSCERACFLVVRDAFDPQWHVSIDDRPATIVPADVALRGVLVPAGTHRIRFTYLPSSLYAGIAVTLAAIALSVVLILRPTSTRFPVRRSCGSSLHMFELDREESILGRTPEKRRN